MAVEDSVAQDQLRAFIERIERMEEEKAAISSDIKEIYAEAKGNGFDTKILRKLVTIRKQDANERMEQEALLELYMSALNMIPAPYEYGDDPERDRLNSIAAQLSASMPKPKADPLAALRADPAMAVVAAADIAPKSKSNLQEVQNAQTEPQPSQPAGSDLTSLAPHDGQVAPLQPETATETHQSASHNDEPSSEVGPQAEASPVGTETETLAGREARLEGEGASVALPPKYAEKGVVTWESTPPEGVERSPISIAFGNMGQDTAVIADYLEKGRAEPIQKIGKVIIDGWARFMAARDMRELDGSPVSYPVVQYAGDDPLIDVIRWNVEGRMLTDDQKRLIAANLCRQQPKRKADIYRAFALFLEPV